MIDAFKRIGEEISKEFDGLPEIERKKKVLDRLTMPIREEYSLKDKKKSIKEILLNLDLQKQQIDLKIGNQLRKQKRPDYFVFTAGSNRSGKKTYFSTNKLTYHLEHTIPDTIEFIEKEISNKTYDFSKFKKFLLPYRDTFYEKKGKKWAMKTSLFTYAIEDIDKHLTSSLGITTQELSRFRVVTLLFDDKRILDTEYATDYVSLRYYYAIERFFEATTKKGVKEEKKSHMSGTYGIVTRAVDIPTKFYITDSAKPSNFEGFNINNSYKSFAITQKEYEEILIGCNFILEKLKFSFQDLQYLVVPKSEAFYSAIENNTEFLVEQIKSINKKGSQEDFEKLHRIAENKHDDFYFDIVFFEMEQSAFNIFKIITEISTLRLDKIQHALRHVNLNIQRGKWLSGKSSLNTIWQSLYSQLIKDVKKDKQKHIYRTKLLAYLEAVYSNHRITEQQFIRDILHNIKKGYLNDKKSNNDDKKKTTRFLIWNAFESLLFLKKMGCIRGGTMKEYNTSTIIPLNDEDIQQFFDSYPEVFEKNQPNAMEKKGLFLLGALVNSIVYAQYKKERNKTFLDKINYDGIKKEKVKKFINEIVEYLKIYSTADRPLLRYNQNTIAVVQESLINIEKSSLKKEEITFYILLGNFVSSQIHRKTSPSEEEQGGEEDDHSE